MILVFVEHDEGEVAPLSLEAVTFALQLARAAGTSMEAIVVGEGGRNALTSLGAFGVASGRLVLLEGDYAAAAWAHALGDVVRTGAVEALIAAGTDRGNELLAHVGAIAGLPMVANCAQAEPGDTWVVTRQRWGGSLLEDARLDAPVKLLTVAPHTLVPESADTVEVAVEEVVPTIPEHALRARVARVEPSEAGAVSLAEARVVVGGGRGVGSREGFAILHELATLLGGVVGVSRAVTSAGWRPHAEQIGQTGERIAPDIYLACGISGASQHMVGCRGAKTLLAINSDPDAPILSKAKYAVIGDLHEVVPAICDEIRRRLI